MVVTKWSPVTGEFVCIDSQRFNINPNQITHNGMSPIMSQIFSFDATLTPTNWKDVLRLTGTQSTDFQIHFSSVKNRLISIDQNL
jgi:hypothetical protein